MKKNIIIILLVIFSSTLLAVNSSIYQSKQISSHKASNIRKAIQPLISNPTSENIAKTLQLFGSSNPRSILKTQTASADDNTRKKLCGTFLSIAENALDAIIDPLSSDDEFESAFEDFTDQAVNWIIWDCNSYV